MLELGYSIKRIDNGYEIIGPDEKVHYRRDTWRQVLDLIEAVGLCPACEEWHNAKQFCQECGKPPKRTT